MARTPSFLEKEGCRAHIVGLGGPSNTLCNLKLSGTWVVADECPMLKNICGTCLKAYIAYSKGLKKIVDARCRGIHRSHVKGIARCKRLMQLQERDRDFRRWPQHL